VNPRPKGSPTGVIANASTTEFVITSGKPANFIFATLDGGIAAWNPTVAISPGRSVPSTNAVLVAKTTDGSAYTGLAGLLDMTGNIKLVADTLGHADTKITGTYLHPSSGGLSSLINERNARNARRTSESAAHFTAHSPSEDFRGVP
jgi:hypothetical protein